MIYGDSGLVVYCGKNNEKTMVSLDNYQQEIKKYHEFSIKYFFYYLRMEQTKSMLKKIVNKESNTLKIDNGLVCNFESKETVKTY